MLRLILESIYEPTFSDYSHGFRMNKSCHTALKYVQKYFTGTKWFVEGDIKGCFDNVDHHVLIAILRKRIADEHFIGLLWKFLKAGYILAQNLSWFSTLYWVMETSLLKTLACKHFYSVSRNSFKRL
mgnify:CR=1 FL=1